MKANPDVMPDLSLYFRPLMDILVILLGPTKLYTRKIKLSDIVS
jgi:hypothetical protein